MNAKLKKKLLMHVPYGVIGLFCTRLGLAWRLCEGDLISEKAVHFQQFQALLFASMRPSFHPWDVLVGASIAVFLKWMVYFKSKNAKKFRKNREYGSARFGTNEDIAPYVDPTFANNVILTQTERITMNNRPKELKTARNKNVLIVGGSGSGKTRFFIKPNLMQCHASYVVTDPKGYTY